MGRNSLDTEIDALEHTVAVLCAAVVARRTLGLKDGATETLADEIGARLRDLSAAHGRRQVAHHGMGDYRLQSRTEAGGA